MWPRNRLIINSGLITLALALILEKWEFNLLLNSHRFPKFHRLLNLNKSSWQINKIFVFSHKFIFFWNFLIGGEDELPINFKSLLRRRIIKVEIGVINHNKWMEFAFVVFECKTGFILGRAFRDGFVGPVLKLLINNICLCFFEIIVNNKSTIRSLSHSTRWRHYHRILGCDFFSDDHEYTLAECVV